MNALLHIGLEKTGSTAIQGYFTQNRALFAQHGIYYPASPLLPDHTKLAVYALRDNVFSDIRLRHGVSDPDSLLAFRRSFKQEFATEMSGQQAKTIILSNEHCSSRLVSPQEIKQLYNLLRLFFEKITVVIYLRRQDQLLLSTFSTSVKAGNTKPISIPDAETIQRSPQLIKRYEYYSLCQRWASVFGKKNILVRPYETSQLFKGDIVSDFLHATSLPVLTPPKRLRLNPSLKMPALEFLRQINAHIPVFIEKTPNPLRGDIVRLLEKNPQFNIEPMRADTRQFIDFFNKSNALVAQEFCNRPDGKLFLEEVIREDDSTTYTLTAETSTAISGYLWNEQQKQIDKIKKVRMRIQKRYNK